MMTAELDEKKIDWLKGFLLALGLIALFDLVFINYLVFFLPKRQSENKPVPILEKTESLSPQPTSLPLEPDFSSNSLTQDNVCPRACLEVIAQTTGSASAATSPKTAVKEINIPLGGGSSSSSDYVEIIGAEAVIDLDRYPEIETVYFEANLSIPAGGGRVFAKLFNVTDKHDAWHSEVYLDGSGPYRAEAKDVILAPGRKLYRVVMKSTLSNKAVLDFARVKILLK